MDLNSVQTNGLNETENTKQTKTKIEKKKKNISARPWKSHWWKKQSNINLQNGQRLKKGRKCAA